MALPLLIGAGVGGLLGLMQGKAQQKAERENMLANAEAIRMSPWTGVNPGMMRASGQSPLAGAAQGALGGAMMGQQFSSAPSQGSPWEKMGGDPDVSGGQLTAEEMMKMKNKGMGLKFS